MKINRLDIARSSAAQLLSKLAASPQYAGMGAEATKPAPASPTVGSMAGRAQKLTASGGRENWSNLKPGDSLSPGTGLRTGLHSSLTAINQNGMPVGSMADASRGSMQSLLKTIPPAEPIGSSYGTVSTQVPMRSPSDFSVSKPVQILSIRG